MNWLLGAVFILAADQIPTPANYYEGLDTTRPYTWCGSMITDILDNKVYSEHTPGLRSSSLSCKNKGSPKN